ncbi:MAG: VOC family protein, partial [Desulfuromonadales bacterium]|nr:VOC family protein [Desulfuromonadales bacterium]
LLATNTRQRLLLLEVPQVTPPTGPGSPIHHAWLLTVDQFERAQKRLVEHGFETGIDPRQSFRAIGEYNMDIDDPDG